MSAPATGPSGSLRLPVSVRAPTELALLAVHRTASKLSAQTTVGLPLGRTPRLSGHEVATNTQCQPMSERIDWRKGIETTWCALRVDRPQAGTRSRAFRSIGQRRFSAGRCLSRRAAGEFGDRPAHWRDKGSPAEPDPDDLARLPMTEMPAFRTQTRAM